jgi:hypothetical protein
MQLETFQINSAEEFPEGKLYYILCQGEIIQASRSLGEAVQFQEVGSDEIYREGDFYRCANELLGVTWPLTCIKPSEESGLLDTNAFYLVSV